MKTIELTQGKVAIVDDEDYGLLSRFTWNCAMQGKRRDLPYAIGNVCGRNVRMQRLIMNAPDNRVVDHINGDTLDNRKCNLRKCTNAENLRNRVRQIKNGKQNGLPLGVRKDSRGRYIAKIDRTYLGLFDCPIAAAMARDIEGPKLHGEFYSPVQDKTPDPEYVEAHRCDTSARFRSTRSASGFKGVVLHKSSGLWQASIVNHDTNLSLGYHDTPEQAARVRDAAARAIWGQDCFLNFPDEVDNIGFPQIFSPKLDLVRPRKSYTQKETAEILGFTVANIYRLL
ncbi:MAG: HNH endonuclease, partial [Candidatus Hydrogenedentes bacterium]|nr:HNH endonuclease [Candidatus Hydrogenedentota bacterium]